MTDIDWSKAPEGATHYHPANNYFYRCKNGVLQSFMFDAWGESGLFKEYHVGLIPRPAPAWNGEGLPPVGTGCEMRHDAWHPNNWPKVTVKYASTEYFITEDGAGEQHWHANSVKFRPIRTPEQIAAEEREAAIKAIVWLIESADSRGMTIAEAIYDAGYRKPC